MRRTATASSPRSRRHRVLATLLAAGLMLGLVDLLPSTGTTAGAAAVPAPQQRSGSAAGLPHTVGADATEADRKVRAREPGRAPGELRADRPHATPTPAEPKSPGGTARWVGAVAAANPGFDPATSVERVERRGRSTKEFANADGTSTGRFYSKPVHYRRADGTWAAIDSSLVRQADGSWRNRADQTQLTFAGTAGVGPMATMRLDDRHALGFELEGAARVAGQAKGSTIRYPDVRPEADVVLEAGPSGVKETLVLASARAPDVWDFPLRLEGLSAAVNAAGNVVLSDAGGKERAFIPHGWMQDAMIDPRSGEGATSGKVAYEVITLRGAPALRVRLDRAWLDDPARVYPVKVDPTASVNASGSTRYVQQSGSSYTSGEDELKVGTYDGGTTKAATLLAFNTINDTLRNKYILGATLEASNIWSYSCNARTVTVHANTESWSASTVRYPGPSYGGALASKSFAYGYANPPGSTSPCPAKFESFPLPASGTDLIMGWVHGQPNYGLTMRASTTDSFAWKKFQSANSGGVYLAVNYSNFGAEYSMPSASFDPYPNAAYGGWTKVTVKNLGSETWTPTNGYRLGYRLYKNGTEVRGLTHSAYMPTNVEPNTSVTLNAWVEPIAPGTGYQVRWDMLKDGGGSFSSTGVPTGAISFDVPAAPPVLRKVFPLNNDVQGTLTPTLYASGEDLDRHPAGALQYRFQLCGGTPATPVGCVDSGWSTKTSWAVPAGNLTWNKDYHWTATARDAGSTVGPVAGPFWLSTAVPQPAITSHLAAASATAGAPGVDAHVGNYATSATDAVVNTVGPPLAVTRTYNSLDPRTKAAFGAGWSSPFDVGVAPDNDGSGNVVVTLANGQQVRFGKNPDGTFSSPQGRFATLLPVTGGGWKLREKTGMVSTFDAAGKLTQVADRHGRAQTLTYSGGLLATARDTTSGRTLGFTWSGGHVTRVTTDPVTSGGSPLVWTYTYTGDQLVKLCGPTSATACTTYAHTTGSHYRSSVLGHSPRAYWRLGEAAGATTAASAVDVNQGNDQAAFSGVTLGAAGMLSGTTDTAASFNGTSSFLRVPDNLVRGSPYLAVELWFKTTSSGVLFAYANEELEQTGTPTAGAKVTPALYVGTDGKLRGQLWDGAIHPITSPAAVNDGNWHHAVLSGAASTQTLYLDGQAVGTLSGAIDHQDMVYNYVGAGFLPGGWPAAGANSRSFFNGTIDEVAVYHHPVGLPAVNEHRDARSAASMLNLLKLPSGKTVAQVGYDVARDRVNQVTSQDGGAWNLAPPAVTGSEGQYRQEVFASTPWSYWQLGESRGTVADSDVAARNDTDNATYSAVTLNADGVYAQSEDGSAHFNGRTAHIRLPDRAVSDAGNKLAVELWFKTKQPGVLLAIQDQPLGQTATSFVPMLYVGSDKKLSGRIWGTSASIVSPGQVTDDKWHHVVLSGDTSTATLILDGQTVGTASGAISHLNMYYTYLGAGSLRSPWPNTTADPAGHLEGEIDEVAIYRHPVSAADAAKHYTAANTPLARQIAVTDPAARTATDFHDPLRGGRIIKRVDVTGGSRSFEYDTGGFLQKLTDPLGHKLTLGHDARGNVVSRTTCQTATACFTSYATYHLNAADPVDPRNDQVTTFRDARSISAADNTYRMSYTLTAAGDLATATTPATADFPSGRTTQWAYTAGTEPATGGGTTPKGLLASVTSPKSNVTRYAYFSSGDLATVTDAAQLEQRYTYDNLGRLSGSTEVSDTFPAGINSTYTYDGWSRLKEEAVPLITNAVTGIDHRRRTTYSYDDDGNLTTRQVADGQGNDVARTTLYGYNPQSRLAQVTDAAGGITTFGYDAFGNLTRQVDAENHEFALGYTPRNQLATTTLKAWTGDPNNPSPAADLALASYAYDAAGRLANHTDAMGRLTKYQYYDDDRLAMVRREVHPTGGVREVVLQDLVYDGAGNLVRQSGPGGSVPTAYTVDASGRVTGVTEDQATLGRKNTLTYDADGNVLTETLSGLGTTRTEVVEHAYDAMGREVRETVRNDGSDLVTTWTRDRRGMPTTMVDPRGNVVGATPADFTTTYAWDSLRQLKSVTQPPVQVEANGSAATTTRPVIKIGLDTFGGVTEEQDANGNTTRSVNDKLGRPTTVTEPSYTPPGGSALTPVTRLDYDKLSQVRSVTDARNNITSFVYDQLGNLARTTDPAVGTPPGTPGVWRYTYTKVGEQLSVTDPTGARTEATYDELGRPVTQTDVERYPTAGNYTSRFDYDDAGNMFRLTTPTQDITTFEYNNLRELTKRIDPYTNPTTFGYDIAGRLSSVTAADGLATVNTYDKAGRLTEQAERNSGGTILRTRRMGYDPTGNQTSATSALNFQTTWAYDGADRLVRQVEQVDTSRSITTTFGYDAAGNQTRLTDGRGNNTIYTFNTLGLPESTIEPSTTAHPAAADRTWTTGYDAGGLPVLETLPGGVRRQRTFDQLGRLTQETGSGAEAATANRKLGWDLAGRLKLVGAPSGDNTYTYNDRSQPLTAAGPGGSAGFGYDPSGRMTSRTDAAGTASFTYTKDDQLATATDPLTGVQRTYNYDNLRRLGSISHPSGSVRRFGYDNLHRLSLDTLRSSLDANVATITYGYDLDDRLTTKTTTGLAGAAANTYGYDRADRLTSWTRGTTPTAYEWDDAGNRTKAGAATSTYDARNRLTNDGTASYTYSPRGTRATRTAGAQTQSFQFDAFERQVSANGVTYAYDSLDRVATRNGTAFTYGGLGSDLVRDGTLTYSRDPADAPLAVSDGTAKHAVWSDQHGDAVATFSLAASPALAASRAFDPFGQQLTATGTPPSIGYQGGFTDPGTSQVNMAARWYDPSTGGFATRDTWQLSPWMRSAHANRYTYVDGNPLGGTDPTGHETYCWWEYGEDYRCRTVRGKGGRGSGGRGGPSGGRIDIVDPVQAAYRRWRWRWRWRRR